MKNLMMIALFLLTANPVIPNGALAQSANLRIVVVEGENAVNIIQQKTAVAPVVEVRDRNDQPVSGASVRFAISKGRATFSGARALTVTTNSTGRAIATGLTPTGSGPLQISATATFQGQTVVAAIAQTNVMTIAAAGAAVAAGTAGVTAGGGGATAGATAGGAAAGAGGGLSATTIGIVGGAVAGGTVVATKVVGSTGDPRVRYSGPYSGSMSFVVAGANANNNGCTQNQTHSGTIRMRVAASSDGTVTTGSAGDIVGTSTVVSVSGACDPAQVGQTQTYECDFDISGRTTALQGNGGGPWPGGAASACSVSGSLAGNTITGTLTWTITAPPPAQGGSAAFPVMLTKD